MNSAEKPTLPGIGSGKNLPFKKRENDYSREKNRAGRKYADRNI